MIPVGLFVLALGRITLNWAGYEQQGSFHTISSLITTPSLPPTSDCKHIRSVSAWVGFGEQRLVQAGISASSCLDATGKRGYELFWENYPDYQSSVVVHPSVGQKWHVSIVMYRDRATFNFGSITRSLVIRYRPEATREWIVERIGAWYEFNGVIMSGAHGTAMSQYRAPNTCGPSPLYHGSFIVLSCM